jgi:hypothetical protein
MYWPFSSSFLRYIRRGLVYDPQILTFFLPASVGFLISLATNLNSSEYTASTVGYSINNKFSRVWRDGVGV